MNLVTFFYVGQFMRPSPVIKAPYGGMTPYRQQCINTRKVNSRPFAWRNVLKVIARPGDGFGVFAQWLVSTCAHMQCAHVLIQSLTLKLENCTSALPNNKRTLSNGVDLCS